MQEPGHEPLALYLPVPQPTGTFRERKDGEEVMKYNIEIDRKEVRVMLLNWVYTITPNPSAP